MRIHLGIIAGNEENLVARFLGSFQPHVDSVSLVRAVGNLPPDRTLDIAAARGVAVAEYKNAPGRDWPHVDNFAAARNQTFAMAPAGTDWIMWADLDDILTTEAAAVLADIRAGRGPAEPAIMGFYQTEAAGRGAERVRLVRADHGARWVNAVHEDLELQPGTVAAFCPQLTIVHMPPTVKGSSLERNRRILEAVPEGERRAYEWFCLFREAERQGDIKAALDAAIRATGAPGLSDEQAYCAYICIGRWIREVEQAERPLMEALRILPDRKEAPYELARAHVARGDAEKALAWIRIMEAQPEVKKPSWSNDMALEGWKAHDIKCLALHAAGRRHDADALRRAWMLRHRPRIAVGHPTIRPDRAIAVRQMWLERAADPDRVAYVFGVNEGDPDVVKALAAYPHAVSAAVPAGHSSATANYNAAAEAAVLQAPLVIMAQDDIYPPFGWDAQIHAAMAPHANLPRVLHVHDGHRDPQQCQLMVIMVFTRSWFKNHGQLMCPEYDGYYCDTEYSWRTYKRGEVVVATDIRFFHDHPIFTGAPSDAEYMRQSNPAAYARGREIFARRNPDAVAAGW